MHSKSRQQGTVRSFLGRVLEHRNFFYVIIIICVLQGIWYAVSYVPSIFDEAYHIGFIKLYAGQLSPIISTQGSEWDYLGAITRSSSYLYHYALSFPLRLVQLFTANQTVQVMFLRAINIGLFVAGLVVFRNLFIRYTKVHRSVIHLALLFFVMTPMVAPLVGAVNYDNMVFVLFAIALSLALRIVKKVRLTDLVWLVIVGMIGVLVKFYFLGLFIPLVIFVLYSLLRKNGKQVSLEMKSQLKNTSWVFRITAVTLLVIFSGLIIERPLLNVVRYGAFEPSCQQVLSKERCMANYTAARNIKALDNKDPDFKPKSLIDFAARVWSPIIVRTQVNILYWKKALPIIKILYLLFALVTVCLIVSHFRYILKNQTYRMFLVLIVSYTGILLLYLYGSYVKFAEPVAISSRYLVPIMPLFLFFTAHLSTKFLKNFPKLLVSLFLITSFLFLQGGGMVSFIVNNDESLLWPNSVTKTINVNAQQELDKVIL